LARALVLALALLLAVPASTAAWTMLGSREPDTLQDVQGGWMFLTPDVSGDQTVRKVYFNGFYGQCTDVAQCTGLNPNVGVVRSGVHSSEYRELAVLGVWKDCNKDGYVGLGEQGLWEYRSTLLLDSSVCPPGSPPPNDQYGYAITGPGWFPPHNDGTWVHEMLSIQWNDVESQTCDQLGNGCDHNVWNVNDNGARVWMDHGLEPHYDIACEYPTDGFPVGTFRTTGGLLHYTDCMDNYRLTDSFDSIAAANAALQPYAFSDAPRDQGHSASKLNQPNPWGRESDASDAQVWDCSKPTTHLVTESELTEVNVSQPKIPPSVSTGGSLAGTANATGAGFSNCNRNTYNNQYSHWGDALAGLPYDESGSFETPYRTQPDGNLAPIEQVRPAAPEGNLPGWGKSAPVNFGLVWLPPDCYVFYCLTLGGLDGVWEGQRVYHADSVLTNGQGARPVIYETYYAYVSPTAISTYGLSLPKGGATGTYGAEACGSATSGIVNGWDCNSADWYYDQLGNNVDPRSYYLGPDPNAPPSSIPCHEYGVTGCLPYGARPGDPYDMLDIDCYDQSVEASAAGVGAGRSSTTVGTPEGPQTVPGAGWGLLTNTSCSQAP
jgi:hypothetical protein